MIDFHCHLDLFPDPIGVARECQMRDMYVLSVTTTPSAWPGTKSLALEDSKIRTALGLHPQLAHERYTELALFDELLSQTRYVGEVGLDGSPECREHWAIQVRVFEHMLSACAAAGGRVLSIHSRRASNEVLNLLQKYPSAGTPVLHWFSGSRKDLDRAVDLDCWFSVGPSMLRSERGRALVKLMPKHRVLTESDGPFAQVNGSPVFPWQVDEAVESLSMLWGEMRSSVNQTLGANLRQLVSALQVSHSP